MQRLALGLGEIMIFQDTELAGVVRIEMELHRDNRGCFARSWCEQEFHERGLNSKVAQCNISVSERKGTLRGVHYQIEPFQEAKLVRCTKGGIYDVAVDLRPESATFMQWTGHELTAANRSALYIPEGCAHGFLTLVDETEVFYQMSEFYHPEAGRGVRWNDPAFQIHWPGKVEVISERDRTYPEFEPR
jgi:dTDP-4-dehydrorhamnose 3,5-epimerase